MVSFDIESIPLAKGGKMKIYMALGVRFQILRGGTKFSEGARFSSVTMFFCKRVISVATLLLIVHISMYIVISLI